MIRSILVLILTFAYGLTFCKTFTSRTLTGTNNGTSKLVINSVSDGYNVQFTSEDTGIFEGNTDSGFAETNWFFRNDKDKTDIYAERINNELTVKGMYKGKNFEKLYKLDTSLWTEFWGLSLSPLREQGKRNFISGL